MSTTQNLHNTPGDVPVEPGHYATVADTPSTRLINERKPQYSGHVIEVATEKFMLTPSGPELTRDCVNTFGSVAVAAINARNEILLLNQYRHPVRMNLWEVPAGLLDQSGEDPLTAAQRELAEEADLSADSWCTLLDYYTTPGVADEAGRIYLARNLRPMPEAHRTVRGEEEAEIIYRWVPLGQAAQLVLGGRIHNGIANQAILAACYAANESYKGLRAGTDGWDFHPYLGGRRTRPATGG